MHACYTVFLRGTDVGEGEVYFGQGVSLGEGGDEEVLEAA